MDSPPTDSENTSPLKKDTLDLELLKKQLRQFAQERDWEQFHTPKNLVMALSVECSELVELFQWLSEEQAKNLPLKDPTLREKIQEEMADILLYYLRLADLLQIDLQEAALCKIEKNREKYPVSLSKGSIKKYTELKP